MFKGPTPSRSFLNIFFCLLHFIQISKPGKNCQVYLINCELHTVPSSIITPKTRELESGNLDRMFKGSTPSRSFFKYFFCLFHFIQISKPDENCQVYLVHCEVHTVPLNMITLKKNRARELKFEENIQGAYPV